MWTRIKNAARKAWLAVVAAALAVAAFFGYDAQSGGPTITDTITITYPTQFVDGSAIPPGAIQKTTIVWGPCGGPWTSGSLDLPAGTLVGTRVRPGEGYGDIGYKANVTVAGVAGVYSTEACKNVQAPAREPGLTVQ